MEGSTKRGKSLDNPFETCGLVVRRTLSFLGRSDRWKFRLVSKMWNKNSLAATEDWTSEWFLKRFDELPKQVRALCDPEWASSWRQRARPVMLQVLKQVELLQQEFFDETESQVFNIARAMCASGPPALAIRIKIDQERAYERAHEEQEMFDEEAPVPLSHCFGGVHLPAELRWPEIYDWQAPASALVRDHFIAQIHFPDLASWDIFGLFPRTGLLYIFRNCVRHWDGDVTGLAFTRNGLDDEQGYGRWGPPEELSFSLCLTVHEVDCSVVEHGYDTIGGYSTLVDPPMSELVHFQAKVLSEDDYERRARGENPAGAGPLGMWNDAVNAVPEEGVFQDNTGRRWGRDGIVLGQFVYGNGIMESDELEICAAVVDLENFKNRRFSKGTVFYYHQ